MVGMWVRRVAWTVVTLLVMGAVVAGINAMGSGSDDNRFSGDSSDSGVATAGGEAAPLSKGDAATPESASIRAAGATAGAAATGTATVAPADAAALGGLTPPTAVGAKIAKTGSVSVEVEAEDWDVAVNRIVAAVGSVGGWVQSSSRAEGRGSWVLAVPVSNFEGTINELRKLGKVVDTSVSGADVTEEYVDIEGRLRHWRAQEALLLGLMNEARTIQESITINQQLSAVQLQIEQLEGKRRVLESRTSFSTISLEMSEPGVAVGGGGGPAQSVLAQAWERAVGASLAVLAGTIVVLGVAVPLALLAALVLGVWWWIRRRDERGARPPAPVPGA